MASHPGRRRGDGDSFRCAARCRHGSALILLVEGVWWQQLPSGAVLCSVAAAIDPTAATSILRRAFAFSLS